MKASATTEIRELTAQELDQVNGGMLNMDWDTEGGVLLVSIFAIPGIVGGLLNWLFG
jgi:hypothetical protein